MHSKICIYNKCKKERNLPQSSNMQGDYQNSQELPQLASEAVNHIIWSSLMVVMTMSVKKATERDIRLQLLQRENDAVG